MGEGTLGPMSSAVSQSSGDHVGVEIKPRQLAGEQVATAFGDDFATMAQIALDGIEACWAPDEPKRALRARFTAEIAALEAVA